MKDSFFPKITKLWLEVSDICNSQCQTCSAWKKTKSENILNYPQILSNPLLKNVNYIINSGSGEPSLADLESILLTEHKYFPNATLQISTNGLLPDKILSAVYKSLILGIKIDVGVSLDGIGKRHDDFRGVEGNFNKITQLLSSLLKLKKSFPSLLSYCVGSTLTDYTVQEAKEMKLLAAMSGAGFMWNWYNPAESFYGKTNFKTKNSLIIDEVKKLPSNPYNDRWLKSLQTGKIPKFKCYALRSFLAIRCNGDVVPCLSRYDQSIGNIMTDNHQFLLNSPKAKETKIKISNCKGCLNSWGCWWSLNSQYFEVLQYKLERRIFK